MYLQALIHACPCTHTRTHPFEKLLYVQISIISVLLTTCPYFKLQSILARTGRIGFIIAARMFPYI